MNDANQSIRAVSRQTGLSPHVIRIWEKRYQAVSPSRTETNRRLYGQDDVERLSLLKAATDLGHSIGLIAGLDTVELRRLTANTQAVPGRAAHGDPTAEANLERCIAAIRALDQLALESALREEGVRLGVQGLLRRVVAPLTEKMGDLWQAGELSAAQEHFASAVIRLHLAGAARPFAMNEAAPMLVVATPPGQLHELGAVLVAAAAVSHGWRVTYLGAALPPAEMAGAAERTGARAVAVSLVYPKDDPQLSSELRLLRQLLPADVALLAGGRAASAYRAVLEEIGALTASDLAGLYVALDEVRILPGG